MDYLSEHTVREEEMKLLSTYQMKALVALAEEGKLEEYRGIELSEAQDAVIMDMIDGKARLLRVSDHYRELPKDWKKEIEKEHRCEFTPSPEYSLQGVFGEFLDVHVRNGLGKSIVIEALGMPQYNYWQAFCRVGGRLNFN